jgi:hypothetical protein
MNGAPVTEAEHLDLHMPRLRNAAFEIDCPVAECPRRQRLRRGSDRQEFVRRIDSPHADAAAAGRGLDEQWKPDRVCSPLDTREAAFHEPGTAGQDGNAGGQRRLACALLVAHRLHLIGPRADPDQFRRADSPRERRTLGQKSVSGVDKTCSRCVRGFENVLDREIAVLRARLTDAEGLIGLFHMRRRGVRLRIDRHRLEAEAAATADDTPRDLAAIGDQHATGIAQCPVGEVHGGNLIEQPDPAVDRS